MHSSEDFFRMHAARATRTFVSADNQKVNTPSTQKRTTRGWGRDTERTRVVAEGRTVQHRNTAEGDEHSPITDNSITNCATSKSYAANLRRTAPSLLSRPLHHYRVRFSPRDSDPLQGLNSCTLAYMEKITRLSLYTRCDASQRQS